MGERPRNLFVLYAALLVPLGLAIVYLPGYLEPAEQRFFYPAFAFLWVLAACLAERGQLGFLAQGWRMPLLMMLPAFAVLLLVSAPKRQAGEVAYRAAEGLRGSGATGPVAGSALLRGGRTGLYLAFHLGQPWLGDVPPGTVNAPEAVQRSGARMVVLRADDSAVADMVKDGAWREVSLPGEAGNTIRVFAR